MKSPVARAQTPLPFTLPGLLPEPSCILLDTQARVTTLLLFPEQGTPRASSYRLRPSAARIFLALLQTYPHSCSYAHLFASLYEHPDRADPLVWDARFGLRALRRAVWSLAPVVRVMGLEIIALRTRGYALGTGAGSRPQEHHS